MKIKPLLFALVVAAAMPTGCAQNPVTGRQNLVLVSEQQEIQMGRQADSEVRQQYGVYDQPALQAYVNEVGQKLAANSHRPNLKYSFTVVDSPDINAFALPGGYIYVTRGILAYLNSEAEMAAVIGHEIGHVTARHGVQQQSAGTIATAGAILASVFVPQLRGEAGQTILSSLGQAILSGYGRDHELEADRLGAEYLARAGYDPQAMIRVIGVLKNQELFDVELAGQEGREPRRYHGVFATHPDNDTRLQQVVGEAHKYRVANPVENRAAFIARINGIIFGDSPEQGVIRNNKLMHEKLGISVQFPSGWRVANQPDKVSAINPARDALIELSPAKQQAGSPVDQLAKAIKLDPGGRIQPASVGGYPAAIAQGVQAGKPVIVALIYFGNSAYFIGALAKDVQALRANQGAIHAAISSFRALTAEERQIARPYRLRTITAGAGTTLAELARQSPLGTHAEGTLRLLNGLYPSGEPRPDQILKIVE